MGISGLLPLLKSIQKPCHVKDFSGQTIGVDAYGWLHRATISCAVELATDKPTRKFVDFAMGRVRMLQHFGVTPFLIFDGDYLPSKAATEEDRAKRREASKKAGLELLRAGKHAQAQAELQKAVDVTPEMARQLIDELKKAGVPYIVAPYEADAQMVYLERKGIITAILSEDSDLLVFGAKCLLTKLDQYGSCIAVNRRDFSACKQVTLTGWTDKDFRHMAILSGCDYLDSITNMGLKTAHRMLRKYKTVERVLQMLKFEGKYRVPDGYLEAFYRAEYTFLYQRVYCPEQDCMTFHTTPEATLDEAEMPYIGAHLEPEIVRGIATGHLNPMTKRPIIVRHSSQPSAQNLRPFLGSQRRATSSVLETKKSRPMDQFLQPRRVPLAELDPNSFILTSGQQEVLRRNPDSWEAQPVSQPASHSSANSGSQPARRPAIQPSLIRSSTEPSRSLPRTNSSTTATSQARKPSFNATATEMRPPKRPRLCADEVTDLYAGKAETTRSRFFASSKPQSAEAGIKANQRRKSRDQSFTIFSDASADTSVDNIREKSSGVPEGVPQTPKVEKSQSGTKVLDDKNSLQAASASTDTPKSSISAVSKSHSFSASTPTQPHTVQEHDQKLRFGFGATPTSHMIFQNGLPTPPSSSRASRIPLAVASKSNMSMKNPPSRGLSTPLQKLGASIFDRFKCPQTPDTPGTPLLTRNSSMNSSIKLPPRPVPFPEVENEPLAPAAVPLPQPDEKEALVLGGGSEDLIIADSEAEDEEDGDEAAFSVQTTPLGSFDLGRFAYKA